MEFLSYLRFRYGRLKYLVEVQSLSQISANSGETYSLLFNMSSSFFCFFHWVIALFKVETETQCVHSYMSTYARVLMENICESNKVSTGLFIVPVLYFCYLCVCTHFSAAHAIRLLAYNFKTQRKHCSWPIAADPSGAHVSYPGSPLRQFWPTSCSQHPIPRPCHLSFSIPLFMTPLELSRV